MIRDQGSIRQNLKIRCFLKLCDHHGNGHSCSKIRQPTWKASVHLIRDQSGKTSKRESFLKHCDDNPIYRMEFEETRWVMGCSGVCFLGSGVGVRFNPHAVRLDIENPLEAFLLMFDSICPCMGWISHCINSSEARLMCGEIYWATKVKLFTPWFFGL